VGVSYLLDSHAFVWLTDPRVTVPRRITAALRLTSTTVHVSAVSAFELATKARLGKFSSPALERWAHHVRDLHAAELGITSEHALLAGRLDWAHRDPFDRLLAAQAIVEGLTLVTADLAFTRAPGVRLLKWH
jgi:PIN domain nuclease of toxin-antitoxin system